MRPEICCLFSFHFCKHMRMAFALLLLILAALLSGCNLNAIKHIPKMPKIDEALCAQIFKQPKRKIRIITPVYPSQTAPNYFQKTSALRQAGFNQKTGNILFLNCIKMKYREVIQKEVEPAIEKYGENLDYPKNTTAWACDEKSITFISRSSDSGSKPYYLMEAICHKHRIHQGIQEIDKMIVRGGDLMQQGCSVLDLYRSDQPGQNLYCLNRINNLAEKGFPAFGYLKKWDPDNSQFKKK